MPELLAPAGDASCLRAAVSAGADAVYLGLEGFNARRGAANFTLEAFQDACDYAHLRGVSVYLALNTVVLPSEMAQALELARQAYRRGADAFIVQDLGLAGELRRVLPQARLHFSTQMNILSRTGLEAAVALGAARVTLARELSLAEMGDLAAFAHEAGLELEAFVHGALCVCYSGQCLMSSLIGGRSANRGMCAQACRLPYTLHNKALRKTLAAPGDYLLSPKDLCGIDLLPGLAAAGLDSLKIEGRMKSPDYVYTTTAVYRKALDRLFCVPGQAGVLSKEPAEGQSKEQAGVLSKEPTEGLAKEQASVETRPQVLRKSSERAEGQEGQEEAGRLALAEVFSRGFTAAYLEGQRGNQMMAYSRPNNRGVFVGRVVSVRDRLVEVEFERDISPGDLLEFWTNKGHFTHEVSPHEACPQVASPHEACPQVASPQRTLRHEGLPETASGCGSRPLRCRFSLEKPVGKGDRVFRVRNAHTAFVDSLYAPLVPVSARISLTRGQKLRMDVWSGARAGVGQKASGHPVSQKARSQPSDLAGSSCTVAGQASQSTSAAPAKQDLSASSAQQDLSASPAQQSPPNTPIEKRGETATTVVTVLGPVVEAARTKAIKAEEVHEHICRTGNTPFVFQDIELVLDEGVGIGFSALHQIRSEALLRLEEALLAPYRDRRLMRVADRAIRLPATRKGCAVAAWATNPACARAARQAGADLIYVPSLNLQPGNALIAGQVSPTAETAAYPQNSIMALPVVDGPGIRGDGGTSLVKAGTPVLVENIGQLLFAQGSDALPEAGPHIPLTNRESLYVAADLGARRIWLSPELTLEQIALLGEASPVPLGLTVAGYQELMTTRHCLLMSQGPCTEDCRRCPRRKSPHYLKDRKGYEFAVVTDECGRSHLYNGVEYDVLHAAPELISAGVTAFMVDTTMMNVAETTRSVERAVRARDIALKSADHVSKKEGATTGHLFRGIS
jgi:putative protease